MILIYQSNNKNFHSARRAPTILLRGVAMLSCSRLLVGASILGTLGACTTIDDNSGSGWIGTNRPLLTTSTVRSVLRTDANFDSVGRNQPSVITCAEPSPDVASAVSSAFGGGLTGNLQLPPTGATPESVQLALAISASRAQAVAQLGERLATIQLLRDGLFRACEAYANGAITPTTYTLITGRIDELLVTLLSTEIAGGAFGRSLAALGGTAQGEASAELTQKTNRVRESVSESQKKSSELDESSRKVSDERRILAEREARAAENPNSESAATAVREQEQEVKLAEEEQRKRQRDLDESLKETEKSQDELEMALKASASSGATATFVAAGGIDAQPSAPLAAELVKIQKNYLDELNDDAAIAACITELSQTVSDNVDPKSNRKRSQLADVCAGQVENFIAMKRTRIQNEQLLLQNAQLAVDYENRLLQRIAFACSDPDPTKHAACAAQQRTAFQGDFSGARR